MLKVIYLSFAQGSNIDGPLLAKSISAVMIRAGQGIWLDPLFWQNYHICLNNKIPFGIWWFCQPNMPATPQINTFMELWNSLPVKPKVIAYDVEEIDYRDDDGLMKKLFPPSKQFNHDNVLLFCKEIKARTGAQVGIYTRKYYFEDWAFESSEWYQFWMWIAAWYNYTGVIQPDLPFGWFDYILHQYEGGGLGTPGVDPATTCKEYFNGTQTELNEFFGVPKTEAIVTSIHVESTPQTARAKVLHWKPNQALKVPIKDLKADAIILTAAGMDRIENYQPVIYSVESFKARHALVTAAGLPMIARVNVHSGYWTIKQVGKEAVLQETAQPKFDEAQKQESVRKNQVIPKILSNLCDGEFTMDKLFAKQLKWLDVKMVEFLMVETKGFKGQDIGDIWHRAAWDHITLGMNWLMLRGYIPTMPMAMVTTPDWLNQFPESGEFKSMLNFSKSWLWLHLGQWTQFSTAIFLSPEVLWQTRPSEDFKWLCNIDKPWPMLEGYGDRVLMHLYAELQQLIDLPGSEVELNLWQDTPEKMREFLGLPAVVVPPQPPEPPTPPVEPPIPPIGSITTLAQAISAIEQLQAWQAKIRGA